MISIDYRLCPSDFENPLEKFWILSGEKIRLIRKSYDTSRGSPVFTVEGKYSTRGWTEWTEGFCYGSSILQFDASNEGEFLEYGRKATIKRMATHVSHIGVHDHGFNNVSTYGNLLRLQREGRLPADPWETRFYELALKVSGAVQASRWTSLPKNGGFIYSFNGPHSLFVDTIRSCRALVVSHLLGHVLMGENDRRINLLKRALQHCEATARYSVFYGENRDSYDVAGRTAHECVFNINDGSYRCPNSQQGYTGFTTWTRGLAWAMCGFAEQLEFLNSIDSGFLGEAGDLGAVRNRFTKAARATCDFYIRHTPTCGVPYWDTGAPGLGELGDYLDVPADPYNAHEPVDSSAAAIGAQGLLRLGRCLGAGEGEAGHMYWQAGLTVLRSLLMDPYLSTSGDHQGLLLHSIYHQPNGWDHKPEVGKVAHGESSMWGDYHIREAALYLDRIRRDLPCYNYFSCTQAP